MRPRWLAAGTVIGVVWAAFPTSLSGQANPTPVVLRMPGSTRSAGLNGAAASLMGDAASVFGNPTGIAIIRHIAVEGAYRPTPAGDYVGTVAGAWRLGQFDLGGGVQYFGPRPGAGPGDSERLGIASVVYRSGLIAMGVSAKELRSTTAGVRERAVGGDWGIAVAVFDIVALAFSMQNVRGNLIESSSIVLPRLSRVGFTMNYVDPQESFRLMSVVEVQWPEGRSTRVIVGGEAGTVLKGVGVVGRLAYGSRWAGYQPGPMTYGASVVISRLIVDYAFEPTPALADARHRIGLRIAF